MFHGSYKNDDVVFLLQVLDLEETPVEEKEALLQSKRYHYSEMISPEYRPDREYMDLFLVAMEQNIDRFAKDMLAMANYFARYKKPIIVSLARAGTPIGVLLKRQLSKFHRVAAPHYSISIIKEKGIDETALLHIIQNHPEGEILFVDGWVSKGSIGAELARSICQFNGKYGTNLNSNLHVVADISGNAWMTATHDDYLIPSAILNSTISGLVSRSIFTAEIAAGGGFHGCKYYSELMDIDLSKWFVEQVMEKAETIKNPRNVYVGGNEKLNHDFELFITQFVTQHGLESAEMLKPGIGETTRALLRRVPQKVLVRDAALPELQHILHLCAQRNVPVVADNFLPFKTMAVLAKI